MVTKSAIFFIPRAMSHLFVHHTLITPVYILSVSVADDWQRAQTIRRSNHRSRGDFSCATLSLPCGRLAPNLRPHNGSATPCRTGAPVGPQKPPPSLPFVVEGHSTGLLPSYTAIPQTKAPWPLPRILKLLMTLAAVFRVDSAAM